MRRVSENLRLSLIHHGGSGGFESRESVSRDHANHFGIRLPNTKTSTHHSINTESCLCTFWFNSKAIFQPRVELSGYFPPF